MMRGLILSANFPCGKSKIYLQSRTLNGFSKNCTLKYCILHTFAKNGLSKEIFFYLFTKNFRKQRCEGRKIHIISEMEGIFVTQEVELMQRRENLWDKSLLVTFFLQHPFCSSPFFVSHNRRNISLLSHPLHLVPPCEKFSSTFHAFSIPFLAACSPPSFAPDDCLQFSCMCK